MRKFCNFHTVTVYDRNPEAIFRCWQSWSESLLDKTAAIQKERKDRAGPFMEYVIDELPSGFVCLGREQVNHHEKANLPKNLWVNF